MGKILDRKVISPIGGSTVAYNLLLAATGAGKEFAIQFLLLLLRSAGPGYEKLFQGGMLASVQTVEDLSPMANAVAGRRIGKRTVLGCVRRRGYFRRLSQSLFDLRRWPWLAGFSRTHS
jgi:hypothetical protein